MILPILPDELQIPNSVPRPFLPNQFENIVTTAGHPADYKTPFIAKNT